MSISSVAMESQPMYRPGSIKHLIDTAANMDELPAGYVLSQRPEEPVKDSAIPVIDLSGLDGPPQVRKPIVDAICSACADWGFFMVINHGIEQSLMNEVLEVSEGFHNLPFEEKMLYASDDVMKPIRYGSSLNTPKKHELHWRDFLRQREDGLTNFCPSSPSNYSDVALNYLDESGKLSLRLFGALSEGLGLETDFIEKSIKGGRKSMESNYYPPCPDPARAMGLSAHTDHGPLTILLQNGVDGLQNKHDGQWFVIHQVPGSLIINVGDYMEVLSNGKYKSIEHRASVNKEKTRISIPSIIIPCPETVLAPASPLIAENNKMKFRPILYGDYMKFALEKVDRSGKSTLDAIRICQEETSPKLGKIVL